MHEERSRSRSAKHYVIGGPLAARLETVLTLVSQTLGFPTVRVNIVEEDTQHTIRLFGAGDPAAVDRTEAFCDTVVHTGGPLVVSDAARDPRFARFPSVRSGEIGAYLGVPLVGREGMVIGAICVIDSSRRVINAHHHRLLTAFGKVVEDQLDLIRRLQEQRLEGEVAVTEIARAIRDREIVPWYQPIVNLSTGQLVGFEALARWEHPARLAPRDIEDPRRFVPVAEDSDLILDLDIAVMRQALTDLRRWQPLNPELRMSVNLSARHLDHPECADILAAVTGDAGVTPADVTLELTETSRLDPRSGHVPHVVHRLRKFGFQVWLDDFGTGWSSLDQLLWLPVDGIKIDRAVTLALGSPVGDAVLAGVTGIARALGLETTIEGVETATAAESARHQGCTYGQGYLWSRPTPADTTAGPHVPAHLLVRAGVADRVVASPRSPQAAPPAA